MKKLDNLSDIYASYDTFIIDLWGVMHNGMRLFPEAIEAVENLKINKKKIIFLSNAPRPSASVIEFLKKLNMKDFLLKNIFTSGEAALKSLQEKKFGKNFFHLGPNRDTPLFKNFEKNKTILEHCDFILCTGLIEEHEDDLDFHKNFLLNSLSKKLICTNPDLTVHRGDKEEYCAGSVAKVFESLGGETVYFGKPYKEVYNLFLNKREKNLIIGDNLNTDIKGANNLDIDSLFITNGVHKSDFEKENDLILLLKKYKVTSKYFQKELKW